MRDFVSKIGRAALANCVAVLALTVCSALLPSASLAQSYPTRFVRMIVTWPAGGGTDLTARKLAQNLEKTLGQPVVIDNRSGANGIIGTEAVAQAAPDGYTVMVTTVPSHAANPFMYGKLPYDSLKDFAPVSIVSAGPLILIVNPAFPVKSVTDLVLLAGKQPGAISYASFGTGSLSHIAGEMFKLIAGVDMVHVPYKGGPPALTDVVGGHVPAYFSGLNSNVLSFIQQGKLRAIAVTGPRRSKLLPDVPTVSETPGFERYEAISSTGVWVPAGTPDEIVAKLNSAVVSVTRIPEFRNWVEGDGSELIGNTPAEMLSDVKQDIERLGNVIKSAGIKFQ